MILNIFSIFLGGGIGAVLRYLVGLNIIKYINLPIATFIVNIVGSFIIGFLYIFFIEKTNYNPAIKLALTVGFCGGLTTFSTFSLELFEMIGNHQIFNAFAYIVLSVIICILSVSIGAYCAKII
jgi:CrcB protein